MITINPYLNFNGNTEEAFTFYKAIFESEFLTVQRFKDTPEAGETDPNDRDKIMHIAMPIGKGTILMGTDSLESKGHILRLGNNVHLSVGTDSEEEAEKIFNALSQDGHVSIPLEKMFWGAYFGMCTDKFGMQWMVSYDANAKRGLDE